MPLKPTPLDSHPLTTPDGGSNEALRAIHRPFGEDGESCRKNGPRQTQHTGVQSVQGGIRRIPAPLTRRMYAR